MTTDTNNTNGTNGIDPQMNRRQMMKTVGAAGGVATVGSGTIQTSASFVRAASAGECKATLMGAAWFTGLSGLTDCLGWNGGDVEEEEGQFHLSILIDDAGLIHNWSQTLDFIEDNDRLRETSQWIAREIGNTSIERPNWVEEIRSSQ